GFDVFDESPWRNAHPEREITGAAGVKAAIAAYDGLAKGDDPLFLWLHLFDPHSDYQRHADFAYGDGPSDRYDAEIAYTDAQLEKLLERIASGSRADRRSEEHTSELQSRENLVCRLLLEKKKQARHQALD